MMPVPLGVVKRTIMVFPLRDADRAEELFQSGEWCRPKYDDFEHVFVMIRKKEKEKKAE